MTITEIVAIVSGCVAVLTLILTSRRDVRGDAASEARTMAKLDSIASGVDDIRVEQRSMRDKVDAMGEKVAKLEGSVSSAHKRIDEMVAKG